MNDFRWLSRTICLTDKGRAYLASLSQYEMDTPLEQPSGGVGRPSKLSGADIENIKRMIAQGMTQADIAQRYKVDRSMISLIKSGKYPKKKR